LSTGVILFVFEIIQRERARPNQRKAAEHSLESAAHITPFLSESSAEDLLLINYHMKAGSINEEEAVVELMGRDATAEFIGCRSKDRYGPSSASLCKQRSVSPSLVTHNSEGCWKWGGRHLAYLSYNVNSMMKVFTWVGAWKLLLLAFMLLSQPSLVAPGRLTKETLGDQVACGHDPSQLEEVNGEVLMNCIKPVYPAGTSPSTTCLSCNRLDGPHCFIATGSGNNGRDPALVCLPCFYADRAAKT